MKSHHFSNPGHGKGPTHKSHKRQHHDGHPLGHPTQHGLSESGLPMVNVRESPDYGSMAEHGFSEGDVHAVMHALPESQTNASLLTIHGLQHVDYGAVTGHATTHPHPDGYEHDDK